MLIEDIKKAAAELQTALAALHTYDEVQNALLEKAAELQLTWAETHQFADAVHELKFNGKPDLKS